jgi:hypothetical protein
MRKKSKSKDYNNQWTFIFFSCFWMILFLILTTAIIVPVLVVANTKETMNTTTTTPLTTTIEQTTVVTTTPTTTTSTTTALPTTTSTTTTTALPTTTSTTTTTALPTTTSTTTTTALPTTTSTTTALPTTTSTTTTTALPTTTSTTTALPTTTSTTTTTALPTTTTIAPTTTTTLPPVTPSPGVFMMTCPSEFNGGFIGQDLSPVITGLPTFSGGDMCGTLGYTFSEDTATVFGKRDLVAKSEYMMPRYEGMMSGTVSFFDILGENVTSSWYPNNNTNTTIEKKNNDRSVTFGNSWLQRHNSAYSFQTELPFNPTTQSMFLFLDGDGSTMVGATQLIQPFLWQGSYYSTGFSISTSFDPTTVFSGGSPCRSLTQFDDNFYQQVLRRDAEADKYIFAYFNTADPNTLCLIRSNSADFRFGGATGYAISLGSSFQSNRRLLLSVWGDHYTVCFDDIIGETYGNCIVVDRSAILASAPMVEACSMPAFTTLAGGVNKTTGFPLHQAAFTRGNAINTVAPCGIVYAQSEGRISQINCKTVNYSTCAITSTETFTDFATVWDNSFGACTAEDACVPMPLPGAADVDPGRYLISVAYSNTVEAPDQVAWALTSKSNGLDTSEIVWGHGTQGEFPPNTGGYVLNQTEHLFAPSLWFTQGQALAFHYIKASPNPGSGVRYRLLTDPMGELREESGASIVGTASNWDTSTNYITLGNYGYSRPQTQFEWQFFAMSRWRNTGCIRDLCPLASSHVIKIVGEVFDRTFVSTTSVPEDANCPVNMCSQTIRLEAPSGGTNWGPPFSTLK